MGENMGTFYPIPTPLHGGVRIEKRCYSTPIEGDQHDFRADIGMKLLDLSLFMVTIKNADDITKNAAGNQKNSRYQYNKAGS